MIWTKFQRSFKEHKKQLSPTHRTHLTIPAPQLLRSGNQNRRPKPTTRNIMQRSWGQAPLMSSWGSSGNVPTEVGKSSKFMQLMSFIQKHTLPPQSLARLRWHRLWPTFCCQWIYHDLPTNPENLKVKNLNISTSNETPILQVTGWLSYSCNSRLTTQDQKQQNVHEHPISTGRCYENIFKLNQKQQGTGVEKGEGTVYYCTFGLVLWTKWGRKQMNRKPMVGYLALYVNFKPFLAWAKDFEELPILHCSKLRLQESIKSTALWRTWSWV